MKKVSFKNKLSLNKETISKLNNAQMSSVIGGTTGMPIITCALGTNCGVQTCSTCDGQPTCGSGSTCAGSCEC